MGASNLPCQALLYVISSMLLLQTHVQATVYTIGDSENWITGVNYLSWSQKYQFITGDVLAFSYIKGQHDVYEVTEQTYRTCDTTSGVLNKYSSGEDRVELKEAKKYWFLCNTDSHCLIGMKFGVTVAAAASAGNGTGDTDTTSVPTTAPPQSSGGGGGRSEWLALSQWACLIMISWFLRLL